MSSFATAQKPIQLYDAYGNPKKPGDKALGIGYDEDGVRLRARHKMGDLGPRRCRIQIGRSSSMKRRVYPTQMGASAATVCSRQDTHDCAGGDAELALRVR